MNAKIIAIVAWFSQQRWRLSLAHLVVFTPPIWLISVTIMALAGASAYECKVAAAIVVWGWWWSHESTQCREIKKFANGSTSVDIWNRGWWPWEWVATGGVWSIFDLLVPSVTATIITMI